MNQDITLYCYCVSLSVQGNASTIGVIEAERKRSKKPCNPKIRPVVNFATAPYITRCIRAICLTYMSFAPFWRVWTPDNRRRAWETEKRGNGSDAITPNDIVLWTMSCMGSNWGIDQSLDGNGIPLFAKLLTSLFFLYYAMDVVSLTRRTLVFESSFILVPKGLL